MALTTTSLMSSSKWGALVALLAWASLLATMSRAQDTDTWYWIMADSNNSAVVCPGRCLAVNDSASTGDYLNKRVGFVACKTSDSSSSSSDATSGSPSSNGNQQWLYDKDRETETTIRINATDTTDTQNPPQLLCLQPDPAKANRSLKVTTCTGRRNQNWIVANNSITSLAFNPPRYLAMTYRLADILDPDEGTGWREAWIVQPKAQNSSHTTTFSMVDGTAEPQLPQPSSNEEPSPDFNFIRNGGFENSSFDFSPTTSNLSLSQNDIFGLCQWQIMKTDANLQGGLNPAPAEGNRSLYLKDGIVKQSVATKPGAYYTLILKVHVATPSPSDSSMDTSDGTNCKGSDTLSVNPYPSTDVHINVAVNGSWAMTHVSFQSLGKQVLLSLRGCATCGCFLDDLHLMQIIDHVPFPPPPPRPSPPLPPGKHHNEPDEHKPPDDFPPRLTQNRLSNWAVVGLVIGASALFFLIGAAFFAVVCVKEKKECETETNIRRPPEWSINTTPVPSERGRGSVNNPDSSNAPTTPTSAPQDPSPRTSSTLGASRYSTSQPSSNPQSGSGV